MDKHDIATFQSMPVAESCRRIDFESIEVRPGFIPDTYFLIVSGTKPWITMTVSLSPLIYIEKPDYWGIEVVGCQSGMGLPALAPYSEVIEITHCRGHKGVEVLGATTSETYDI